MTPMTPRRFFSYFMPTMLLLPLLCPSIFFLVEAARPDSKEGEDARLASHADVAAMQPGGALVHQAGNASAASGSPNALLEAHERVIHSHGLKYRGGDVAKPPKANSESEDDAGSLELRSDHSSGNGEVASNEIPNEPFEDNAAKKEVMNPEAEDNVDMAAGSTEADSQPNNEGNDGNGTPSKEVQQDAAPAGGPEIADSEGNSPPVTDPHVTEEQVRRMDLFPETRNTAATELKDAASGIKDKLTRVDGSVGKLEDSMGTYQQSISTLANEFQHLRARTADMHSEVLTEFKSREASRMCAFANVERLLKGQAPIDCGNPNAIPIGQDYNMNLAAGLKQHSGDMLAEGEKVAAGSQGSDAEAS